MSDSFTTYGCACVLCCEAAAQAGTRADLVGGGQGGAGVSVTTAQAAAEITRGGFSWSAADGVSAGIVTYGFRQSYDPDVPVGNFTRLNLNQQAAVDYALGLWSDVAAIWFQKVGAGTGGVSYTDQASMLFANYSEFDGANGFAFLPTGDRSAGAVDGDVYLNLAYGDTFGLNFSTYGWVTVLHEIGHAIGLQHPGDYTGSGDYFAEAGYAQDSRQYSVMSYFDSYYTGANHNTGTLYLQPSTPMLHDIAAAQALYGPNWYTRTGDTCYGFFSNADKSVFRLSTAADDRVFAVWDAGGYDIFNFSLYATNQFISLIPGTYSSTGRLTSNVAIAEGAIIEAAASGSGHDTLYGNAANNALYGSTGNDWLWGQEGSDYLDGGAGYDIAIYEGGFSRYALAKYGTTIYVFDGQTGDADALIGVDAVTFSQGPLTALDLAQAAKAPGYVVADVASAIVFTNSTTKVSDWFTGGSYFANVGIYGYLVQDTGGGAGALQLDGRFLSAGGWHWVSTTDFERLNYVGGVSGSESIGVLAYMNDGSYSNHAWVGVTNRGPVPTVTATTTQFGVDFPDPITTPLTATFTVTAPGPAVATYAVSIGGEASLILANGQVYGSGQSAYLTPSQYASAQLVTSGQGGTVFLAAIDALGGVSDFAAKTIGPVDMPANAATTASVAIGGTYRGQIQPTGDADWIAVQLNPGLYTVAVRGSGSGSGTLFDPMLRLYDGAGVLLETDNDGGSSAREARVTLGVTTAGTYYIEVSSADSGAGTYLVAAAAGFSPIL